ncbi:MAG: DUF11 domain-containing protein [Chloroflexi bacterium]|nr:DUF11 domain-containing protein [Chloroflexota bacterium]
MLALPVMVAILVLVSMSAGGRVPVAHAATFTVDSTADAVDDNPGNGACHTAANTCTLRAAIMEANALAGADIITLPAGTYQLTLPGTDNTAAGGDLDINSSVTINGGGAATTIIQMVHPGGGPGDYKVFGVNQSGAFSGITVAINDVTITGGRNDYNATCNSTFQETGGGIDFYLTGTGNAYSMTNVIVTDNQTTGCAITSYGGGINVDSRNAATPGGASAGTVTFTNVTVTNNVARAEGGGINLQSDKHDVTLSNVTITGNSSTTRDGGGLRIRHSFGGTVTVNGGTISNNTGIQNSGGVQITGNQVVNISGVTISNNNVTGVDGIGAGVTIANLGAAGVTGNTSITNSTISNNHADNGAGAEGGGVWFGAAYSATITGSSITGNTTATGAGVFNQGSGSPTATLTITGTTISGNTASVDGGGGGANNSAVVTMANVTISTNTARRSGGGYISLGGATTATNVTITNNRADNDTNGAGAGGGIAQTGGTVTLNNTIVAGNFNDASPSTTPDNISGTVVATSASNVIGPGGSGGLTNGVNNNKVGVNALLAPLANYSGSTLTHALLPGSPAINAGNNGLATAAGVTADQRGISRPRQTIDDVGAFESRGFTMTKIAGDNQTTKIITAFPIALDVQVTSAFSEPVDGGQVTFTPPSSGASASLSPNPATIASGHAIATATANGTVGTYTVAADAAGANSVSFTLTNIAPDLTAVKADTVSGSVRLGNTWQWQTVITNSGNATADYTIGQTIFTDVMPSSNVSYGSPSISASSGITGTIACVLSGGNTVSCTASGTVSIAASGGAFQVDVTATPTAVGTYANPTGGVCQADPNNYNPESNEGNNTCMDTVVVIAPDLSVSKTNTVSGSTPLTGTWEWRTTVSNAAGAASADFTNGQVIFRDVMPATGVSYGSPSIGTSSGITGTIICALNGAFTVECTASGAVSIAASGSFRVDVTATPTAAGSFVNPTGGVCQADPDTLVMESNENNNACTNTVTAFAAPTVTKTFAPATIAVNGASTLTITITNPAGNPGPLTGLAITDALPSDVVVATPLTTTNTCGGTLQDSGGGALAPGDTGIRLTGGTSAAGGSTCAFSVIVTAPTTGAKVNTTGAVSSTNGGTGNTATATLTVLDPPTINKAFAPTSFPASTTSTVTLTLANSNSQQLTGATFTDTLMGLTAAGGTVGGDCVGTSPAMLAAGATMLSFSGITIPPMGSCTVTFAVTSTMPGMKTNATSGVTTNETPSAGPASNTAPVTVLALPVITIGDVAQAETNSGTTTLSFTVSLSQAAGPSGVSFDITTANDTATTADSDYVARTLTGQSIPSGMSSYTFDVTVNGDTKFETDETFFVNVTNVVGAAITDGQGVGTIQNDDTRPTVTLSLDPTSVTEGAGANLTATLSNLSAETVTVTLGYTGTAGPTDHNGPTTIGIMPNTMSGTVILTATDDPTDEPDETLVIDITAVANGAEATPAQQVTLTITDNDAPPTVSLAPGPGPLAENFTAAAGTVTATLSTVSGFPVTVTLEFGGTATLNSDYTRSGTTIMIPAGMMSGTMSLAGIDDTTDEPDETVVVSISTMTPPVNATIGSPSSATYTIADNDPPPTVSLSLMGSPMAEAGGTATVTATLSQVSAKDVTVTLAFAGTATNVTDYTRTATIMIPAGMMSGTATLTAVQDMLDEDDETIIVSISATTPPLNATAAGGSVTATITDDDLPPTVSLSRSPATFNENGGTATVTATLSVVSGKTVTVMLAFSGQATFGVDYMTSASTITIPPGMLSGSVTLTGIDDAFRDTPMGSSDESVIVDIMGLMNATSGMPPQVTLLIIDDDTRADLSITKDKDPAMPLQAAPGGNLTYVLTVTNAGPDPAGAVVLTDVLPSQVTYQSHSTMGAPGWNCSTPAVGANGTVTCSIASMAVGTATIRLVVKVDPMAMLGTMFTNTATVSSATIDPNPGQESDDLTIEVFDPVPRLSFTMTATPDPVRTGQPLTYTFTIRNTGSVDITGITLGATLPARLMPGMLTKMPPSVTCNITLSGQRLACAIGTLTSGQSATITLPMTVGASPGQRLMASATVQASAIDGMTGMMVQLARTASTTTLVRAP